MKTIVKTIMLTGVFFTMTLLCSCSKSSPLNPAASGALNLVNAVAGGAKLTLTSNPSITFNNNTLGVNAAAWFPLAAGQTQLNVGVPAIPAAPPLAAVPAVPYYSTTLSVNDNSNYSLFLAGASPAAVDHVLIKESYTRTYADSVCGVRVINLVSGSNPVSVDIKGQSNGSEVKSLAYLSYSDFNQHPALKLTPSYVFEFRDAASGMLLTSYTLTTPYFHNVTLCLKGTTTSYGVILDPDYN